jgi:hypothetical protein
MCATLLGILLCGRGEKEDEEAESVSMLSTLSSVFLF